jgi:hypothetical protein
VRLLVAALWAGSLWTIGYVVAPTLFLSLHDNVQAGTIVGFLLRTEAWLSIACAVILYLLVKVAPFEPARKRMLSLVIVGMLACALIIYAGLQPVMANLKQAAGAAGLAGTPQGAPVWHPARGVATGVPGGKRAGRGVAGEAVEVAICASRQCD